MKPCPSATWVSTTRAVVLPQPTNRHALSLHEELHGFQVRLGGCYGANREILLSNNQGPALPVASLTAPAVTVMFADVTLWHCDPVTGLGGNDAWGLGLSRWSAFESRLDKGCYGGGCMLARHMEMAMVCFADGHVKAMHPLTTERAPFQWAP